MFLYFFIINILKVPTSSSTPRFLNDILDQFVKVKDQLSITYNITGENLSIHWFRDDKEITSNDKITLSEDIKNNLFTISCNQIDDSFSGRITCKANNTFGSNENSFNIFLIGILFFF